MGPDDLHNDCQTQTGTLATNSLAAPEALEDMRPILGWDARTAVLDTDRTVRVDLDHDLGSRRRMHECVFDQIAQRIGNCRSVSDDDDRVIGAGGGAIVRRVDNARCAIEPTTSSASCRRSTGAETSIATESRRATQGTQTIFIRDVGSVEDGADIQTGYALVDGRRTVYIPVTKRADASTLAVVQAVKANLPRFQSVLPDDVKVSYEFDQSPYVTGAIRGLLFEGALGVVLTGLMVLLFLRDWRSSLFVVLNIPLAILASVTALWVLGQTINIMTLGGLALAVGILVDEATVTIENIHTRLADGRGLARATSEATAETTLPRFVAMICILAVFIPAFFMTGAAHNLFVPLALAVGFSMVGSYLLSSTFVPVLASGRCAIRMRTMRPKAHFSIGCAPGMIGSRAPS